MKNFHIKAICIDGMEPYFKINFEDLVNKDVINTWLNSQGFIRKANIKEDDNYKVSAIVYPYSGSDLVMTEAKIKDLLSKIQA